MIPVGSIEQVQEIGLEKLEAFLQSQKAQRQGLQFQTKPWNGSSVYSEIIDPTNGNMSTYFLGIDEKSGLTPADVCMRILEMYQKQGLAYKI